MKICRYIYAYKYCTHDGTSFYLYNDFCSKLKMNDKNSAWESGNYLTQVQISLAMFQSHVSAS